MFGWIRRIFGSASADVGDIAPTQSPVVEQPARPSTTWKQRAAAVGALVESGETPGHTPISVPVGKPRAKRSKRTPRTVFPPNPLHIPPKDLGDFFAHEPRGIEKYQAAERRCKELGSVDGRHYTAYSDEVEDLLKGDDHDVTIVLLLRLVDAVEAEARFAGSYVPPSWHGQLAAAYIKIGRRDLADEVGDRLALIQKGVLPHNRPRATRKKK